MEGYLEKWSKKTESFEKRYVVICPNNKTLFYFINDDMKDINNPRGRISLEKVLLSLEDSETPTFTIILDDKKVLLFKAPDINSRNAWISKISEISLIFHHNNDKNTFSQSQLCLDALKDSSDELRDALESSTQMDGACVYDLKKFSKLLNAIHNDIDSIKFTTDYDLSASDAENDEISADQFFDCREISESPKIISISDDQDGVQYDIESDYNEEEIPINASIITHMLSQVKIGMDLSKITLPTFILERRSLLEMFGDFFSRPAHLYNAVKMVTPKERFVAVLQYYMGSFYPGRRVEVSKKPYNPILGEKFQCFYKFNPDRTKSPNNIQGPVSWAKTWDLSFIAEQVSHHPPISAFYAECPEAKVSCNAYIYTKSRFLGLSIGVQNIGKGVVSLHQYDEDYEFNFPSGYARSIISVPWFELGGKCYLKCEKTRYHAQIEFTCKSLFNTKKHKIHISLFEPDVKKPFALVTGEWNGVMFIETQNEKNIFIDSTHEPINRKYVLPQADQEPNDSRIIWKDVTRALKIKDIEAASASKHNIEERQRNRAKERTESWIPKYFKCTQNNEWIYINPLKDRL